MRVSCKTDSWNTIILLEHDTAERDWQSGINAVAADFQQPAV